MPNKKKKSICNIFGAGTRMPSHVKKAICATKTSGIEFDLIKNACGSLGLDYESPGVVSGTVVHFSIPKYKFAILFDIEPNITAKKTVIFARIGWHLAVIKPISIIRMTDEQIIDQLKSSIAQLTKGLSSLSNRRK
jgi:hypothetical protein